MMKKITKICAIAALFIASATASASAQLYYGVKIGTNIPTTSIKVDEIKDKGLDGFDQDKSEFGYQVGAVIGTEIPIIGIGIEAEALWMNSKIDFAGMGKVNSNSFEVPVMAVVPVAPAVSIKAGPTFMLHNDATLSFLNDKISKKLNPIKSSIGYTVGIGLNLAKFTADLRFNGQFKSKNPFKEVQNLIPDGFDFFNKEINNVLSEYDLHANTLSLSVGYRF